MARGRRRSRRRRNVAPPGIWVAVLLGLCCVAYGYVAIGGRRGTVVALVGWAFIVGAWAVNHWLDQRVGSSGRRRRRRRRRRRGGRSRERAAPATPWWRDAHRLDPWSTRAAARHAAARSPRRARQGSVLVSVGTSLLVLGIGTTFDQVGAVEAVAVATIVSVAAVVTARRVGMVSWAAATATLVVAFGLLVWVLDPGTTGS